MSNAWAGPFLNFLALHNERKLENPEKFERLRTTFWPFAVAGGFLFGLGIAGGNAFMSGMGVRVRSRSRCDQQRICCACQHPFKALANIPQESNQARMGIRKRAQTLATHSRRMPCTFAHRQN